MFTDGEWKIEASDTYAAQVVSEVARPRSTRKVVICRCPVPNSSADYDARQAEAKANARLIAGSKELIRMLQDICDNERIGAHRSIPAMALIARIMGEQTP